MRLKLTQWAVLGQKETGVAILGAKGGTRTPMGFPARS